MSQKLIKLVKKLKKQLKVYKKFYSNSSSKVSALSEAINLIILKFSKTCHQNLRNLIRKLIIKLQ